MRGGKYADAYRKYKAYLQNTANKPEQLIYKNNALSLAKKTKDSYKIGVSVPIGGDLNVAQEILRGVAQAQNEINHSGGINGKLFMVEIANDDNDPELAKKISKIFILDKEVLAVIGPHSSNASMAAAPIYQDKGLSNDYSDKHGSRSYNSR